MKGLGTHVGEGSKQKNNGKSFDIIQGGHGETWLKGPSHQPGDGEL